MKLYEKMTGKNIYLALLWLLFLGFLLLSLTKPLYQDEGVFLTIGRGVAEGKLPYLDFWDHKTPGIYLLFGALSSFFGTKIILYKIFIWLVNFLTAILVYGISERFRKGAGSFASVIFLLSLVFFEGNYLGAGPFLALLITLATWLLMKYPGQRRAVFAAGISAGLAILFKQTAILSLLPLLFLLHIENRASKKYFFSGTLLVGLSLFVYLTASGILNRFLAQAISANFSSYPPEKLTKVLQSWWDNLRRLWWVFLGAGCAFLPYDKIKREQWVILALAIIPISAFLIRDYPHYWLQVIPFWSVLAGIGLLGIWELKQARLKYLFSIAILITMAGNLSWFFWMYAHINKPLQTEETLVTEALRGRAEAKILVENRYTGFYFLSGRENLIPYLYLTEVNEGDSARLKTLEAIKNEDNLLILWPHDQDLVYAKEIGDWIERNCLLVAEYPALDLVIYQKLTDDNR